MLLASDIRPVLYAARVLGSPFHVVTEDDIKVTKYGKIYTLFSSIMFVACAVTGIYFVVVDSHLDLKLLILTVTRTVLSYMCLLTDIALTTVWNWKIRAALSHLRNFDRAIRFNGTRNRSTVRNICCAVIIAVVAFWTVVGCVTYRYEPTASLFNGLTYGIINAAISMQILTFVSISFLLRERFRRLCQILLLSEAEGKVMVVDRLDKEVRLQEVWWLHCCLANATEMINSVYALQLLLWIASMSFNTLSRLYTINESSHVPTILKIRESLLVTACAGNLLLIASICHATASQDNVEAAAYFQLRKVHFFAAAGLIRIDLPLLLSIASGITTYLVILHAANGA